MTVRRCPSCAAQVAETAQWCGLCYTRLDVEPTAPVEESAAAFVSLPVPTQSAGRPMASVRPDGTRPVTDAAGIAPAAGTSDKPEPTWPCVACGSQVPVELNACPGCGIGFLAQVSQATPVLRVPGVGDVSKLNPGIRLALGGGIGLLIAMVIAVILALFS